MRASGWILLAATAGCASGPPVDVMTLTVPERAAFAGAAQDPTWRNELPEPGGELWHPGDTLRFGLRLEADGEVQQWLLELSLLAPPDGLGARWSTQATLNQRVVEFSFRPVRVAVEVFDADGRAAQRDEATLIDEVLATGPVRLCEFQAQQARLQEKGTKPAVSDAQVVQMAQSAWGIVSLFEAIQTCDALSPILWEVVERPSLLAIVFAGGVTLNIRAETDRARRVEQQICGSGPLWELPITVLANDSPALVGKLLCAEPRRPLQLSAGIVGLEASHPTDASRRFSVRLLGLR